MFELLAFVVGVVAGVYGRKYWVEIKPEVKAAVDKLDKA